MKRLVWLLLIVSAHAATVYVSPGGGSQSCGADGTQSTTAVGSVTWTAGNTYKLCTVFTGSILVGASGTAGNPITIIAESGSSMTAPAYNTTAFSSGGHSYIILNGNNVGFTIKNTANGTAGAFANSLPSIGIDFSGSSNSTIENLAVSNIYVRTGNSTTDNSAGAQNNRCIQWSGGSNNTITNVTTHDCRFNFYVGGASDSNITITNNTAYNQAAHWWIAPGNTGSTLTNVVYSGNTFHDPAPAWDSSPNDYFHIDGVHYFCQATSTCSGFTANNNYFYGSFGVDYTAQIFTETDSGTNAAEEIFNNLIVNTTPTQSSNGAIDVQTGASGLIANNTIVGSGSANGGVGIQIISGTGITQKNNIVQGFNYMEAALAGVTFATSSLNTNLYFDFSNGWQYHGSGEPTFANWKSATGQDGSSINSNPMLNSSYIPNSSSPAIGAGTNLTSLGITALDSDLGGAARPASGAWTIGAFNGVYTVGDQQPVTTPFYPGTLFTTPIPAAASNECWNPAGGSPVVCGASSADLAVVNNMFSSADSPIYFNSFSLQCLTSTNGDCTNSFGNAFYYASASDPVYRVNVGSGPCPGGPNATSANCAAGKYFHMTAGAIYDSCQNDEGISIWDQSTDIDATPGGRIVSTYSFNSGSCPSNPPTITSGCTATTTAQADSQPNCQLSWGANGVNFPFHDTQAWGNGLTSDGSANNVYMLREAEIMQNTVKHALGLDTACLRSAAGNGVADTQVFPATGNAIGCSFVDVNRPLNGNLFWIDSGFNCAALPAWQAPVCVAMQTYGGYVHATQGGSGSPLYIQPLEGGMAHTIASVNDTYFNNWIISNGVTSCPGGGYPKVCTGPVDSGQARLEVIEDSASTSEKIIAYFFQMPGLITGHHLHILDPCVAKSLAGVSGGCLTPGTSPPSYPTNFVISLR